MHAVLIKNNSREALVLNVGDRSVEVHRREAVRTRSGKLGTRSVTARVSSSISLLPGESRLVSTGVLKQRAMQLLRARGLIMLKEVQGEAPVVTSASVGASSSSIRKSGGTVVEEGRAKRSRRARREED